jgi:hypothetical protein
MAESFKCPHCGALYDITWESAAAPDDAENAPSCQVCSCQVCGKQMGATSTSLNRRYELVQMPDGTNV